MTELMPIIQEMKCKGATSPDKIPPSFLKSFDTLALNDSFPSSFYCTDCPGTSYRRF